MLCCGKPSIKEDPILDVDALVRAEIQRRFGRPNFCERLTKKYELQVQWSFVEQSSSLHSFKLSRKQHPDGKDSRKMCLFRTEFTNKSKHTQRYTFKTERQTKSTVKVTVQKSFSLGGSLNVPFGVPSVPVPGVEPLAMTGGLTGTLNITKTKEKTFEENLMWSVDNAVEVPQNSRTTASLIIEEEKATAEFEIRHVLTPKLLTIPVHLVEKGPGGRVIATFNLPSGDLGDLVVGKSPVKAKKLNGDSIEIITEGVSDMCYGAKQIISIDENPYVASQESIIHDDMLAGSFASHLPKHAAVPVVTASKTAASSPKVIETKLIPAKTSNLASSPSDDNLKKPLLQMRQMKKQDA